MAIDYHWFFSLLEDVYQNWSDKSMLVSCSLESVIVCSGPQYHLFDNCNWYLWVESRQSFVSFLMRLTIEITHKNTSTRIGDFIMSIICFDEFSRANFPLWSAWVLRKVTTFPVVCVQKYTQWQFFPTQRPSLLGLSGVCQANKFYLA